MKEELFDLEFKEALSRLPDKEKDKLILRFLKKDLKLAQRLYFELVSTYSVEELREKMKEKVHLETQQFANTYYSPGYLMMDLRYLSGDINAHVSTTKDKIGEIELQLYMVSEILTHAKVQLEQARLGQSQKLYVYLIAKVFKMLLLLNKLHED